MTQITAIARIPEQIDIFRIGEDGRVYTTWSDSLHWGEADWFPIGGFFPAGATVSAVARQPDQLDLFVVGNDGRVYTSWWSEGNDWSGVNDNWSPIGGFFPAGATVSAVARKEDQLDLFVVGNDGRVYTSWWSEGNDWSGVNDNWSPIGGFFPPGTTVSAVARQPDQLDLFVVGNDGRVYTSWWSEGNDWSGVNDNWSPIGGFFPDGATVSAVARQPDQLDLFVVGHDGRVYTSWWSEGNDWSGLNDNWSPIGGFFPPGTTVSAVARQPDQLDLFVVGHDGRVYTSWWSEGNDWSGLNDNWSPIGGFFPPGTTVSAVARQPDQLDLFVVGNDGLTYTSSWSEGNDWTGINDNWQAIADFSDPHFDIELIFQDNNLTEAQRQIFSQAVNRWERIITGDLPSEYSADLDRSVDDLVIEVFTPDIDGIGNRLGEAGPRKLRADSNLPFLGNLRLDLADLVNLESQGSLDEVILHEIGHILGIGTIWDEQSLISDQGGSNPEFLGTQAVNEYRNTFRNEANSVPVEADGEEGTRDSHWDEDIFRNELMTGWLEVGLDNPLSSISVASLADLGYQVNIDAADAYSPPSSGFDDEAIARQFSLALNAYLITGTREPEEVEGTEGNDIINGRKGDDTLGGLEGQDTLKGGSGDDSLLGGEERDNLRGGKGNDTLDGGSGDDLMQGNGGNDTYLVDSIGDRLQKEKEDGGLDTIIASVSYRLPKNLEDLLLSGNSRLTARGNNLNNQIVGNRGRNRLLGKDGDDTLKGGSGDDQFLFNHREEGIDTILDFTPGEDQIAVKGSGFSSSLNVGTLEASQFRLSEQEITEETRFIYSPSSGKLFFDADGSGEIERLTLAVFSEGSSITFTDIIVI